MFAHLKFISLLAGKGFSFQVCFAQEFKVEKGELINMVGPFQMDGIDAWPRPRVLVAGYGAVLL